MAAAGKLRYAYLAFFSKPSGDRKLYRLAKRNRVRKIVELGVDSLERSLRLVSVCQRYSPEATIAYTGLDWFDERPAGESRLSLIDMHREMKGAGAAARLMPGGPAQALAAIANSLLESDLVLVSQSASDQLLAGAWFYVPRLLKTSSVVLQGQQAADGSASWIEIAHDEIERQASAARTERAA